MKLNAHPETSAATDVKATIQDGTSEDASSHDVPTSWESYYRAYLTHLIAERGLSNRTVDSYWRDVRHYLTFLANRNVDHPNKCGYDHILIYVARLRAGGLSAATVARRLTAISSFHRFLVREGFAHEDPTINLERPHLPDMLPNYLTEAEMEKLLEQPSPHTIFGIRDRAILEMLYATGLRVSELVNLTVADVNLETGFVRCIGKGDRERIVPLGRKAIEALQHYITTARPELDKGYSEHALFLNCRGRRLSRIAIFRMIKRYARIAGIRKLTNPHTIRHTFATHLLRGGADLRSIQELLGHVNIATTQVYTHLTTPQLRNAYRMAHPRARRQLAEQPPLDESAHD